MQIHIQLQQYSIVRLMSEQFRRLLQQFYCRINTTKFTDVYKRILKNKLDQVEVQPIHILTLKQQPIIKQYQLSKKKSKIKQHESLYKNSDFASVMLFGLLLQSLKKPQNGLLKNLQQRTKQNIKQYYGQNLNQQSLRYNIFFNSLFQFGNLIINHQYNIFQIQQLFKSFFNNSIQRKGLKKIEKQKYGTEAQNILSFIMAKKGSFPTKRQISEPASDIYQSNSLNLCVNIQIVNENQQWTIGEGQNHITIMKQKNQYSIQEEEKRQQINNDQENLSQSWLKILQESKKLKQQQSSKTSKLFTQFNIVSQSRSPTKSVKYPISAHNNNKQKNSFI